MKNKSKLAKRKQKITGKTEYPKEWLYMCGEELDASKLKEALEQQYSVEYWDTAGVIEVEIEIKAEDEKSTYVYFEVPDLSRADDATKDYIEKRQIKTVFLVSIDSEQFPVVKEFMKQFLSVMGGFFCGDTVDFQPEVAG